MDEINARLIYLFTDLILPLIVGYLLYQRRLLSDAAVNLLIRINVIVFFTLLSLFSFWALPLTRDLFILPAFFAFIILFPGFISWRFLGRRFHSPIDRGTHLISALLSNIGTLGGICAYIIYGERGFAYAQIGGACQNLVLVLLAFPIAQYFYLLHKARGRVPRLEGRGFLGLLLSWNQLSIVGMTAGLLLNASGIARPPVLSDAFGCIIHIAAWFGMLPIGSLINFRRARHFVYLTLDMIALRSLIVPIVTFAAARLLISDPTVQNALVIFASAPAAINATLTARLYHLNVDYTIAVFLVTTVLYLTVLFPVTFFLFR
ncbi:putative membrane protein [Selenomonas sp. FOBRC6]|uniref:AEC family transporter n=1 Tax=Selenomonas sp. FOBRC6 TaxID=936572 RepID=UPI0002781516|nr:transporter [Selenomonas sp. FOBRC6]EJO23807.1 putative membrane protein [Selenomonas sp. FOBRC6]